MPAGQRTRGLLLAVLGVLLFTPDAMLFRLTGTSAWTLLFWRSLLTALALLAYWLFTRRTTGASVWPVFDRNGIASMLALTLSEIGFIYSILHAPAADAIVVLSSAPIFAALVAWGLFCERPSVLTCLAIAASLVGVLITVRGTAAHGNAAGSAMALLAASSWAVYLTLLQQSRTAPEIIVIGANLLAAGVALTIALPEPLSTAQTGFIVLLGLILHPLSFMLIGWASKYITSAEVGLVTLIEILLGPFWVWLVLGEGVSANTLLGGTVVLAALLTHAWLSLRQERTVTSPYA